MLADQPRLVAIPQVQTVQQQIQDRLRKLSRHTFQDLQQVPATPDRMRQARLVEGLQKPIPSSSPVMHQETIVIGPQHGRRFGKAPMRLDPIHGDRFVANHSQVLQLAADAPPRVVQPIQRAVPQPGRQLFIGGSGQLPNRAKARQIPLRLTVNP